MRDHGAGASFSDAGFGVVDEAPSERGSNMADHMTVLSKPSASASLQIMSYGSLTSYGAGAIVPVLEPQLHRLIKSVLQHVEIDEKWYVTYYKDVDKAIAEGKLESARQHYFDAGYFENRLPRPIKVDEKWYLNAYRDVADAIERSRFANAQEHFEHDGFREGRLAYKGWTL